LKKWLLLIGLVASPICFTSTNSLSSGQSASIGTNNIDTSMGVQDGLFFLKIEKKRLNNPRKQKTTFEQNDGFYISRAKHYLVQNKSVFGVESVEDLFLNKIVTDQHNRKHVRLGQMYHGFNIKEVEFIVHFNQNEQVTGVNGYMQALPLSLRLSVDKALNNGETASNPQAVLNQVAKDLKVLPSRIEVLSNQPIIILSSPYLVWQVDVVARSVSYNYMLTDTSVPKIIEKKFNIQP